jgi:cytochrome c oxidase subunit IV
MRAPRPPRRIVSAWLILLAMLGGNIGLAYIGLGDFGSVAHVAIAVAMVGVVLLIFMELDRGASLFWVFAGAGFFWLAMLFALTAADYITRYNFAPAAAG